MHYFRGSSNTLDEEDTKLLETLKKYLYWAIALLLVFMAFSIIHLILKEFYGISNAMRYAAYANLGAILIISIVYMGKGLKQEEVWAGLVFLVFLLINVIVWDAMWINIIMAKKSDDEAKPPAGGDATALKKEKSSDSSILIKAVLEIIGVTLYTIFVGLMVYKHRSLIIKRDSAATV